MASKKKSDPFVRCFEVCDPTLHPKGHTIYKVILKTIRVDIPEADVTETIVWRRYNDFKKLYKAMSTLHRALHRKEVFPPFAAGKVFGRFDSAVLNERQQSAQDLLNFVGQKHYLVKSKAFRQFFEGGEQGVVNPHSDPVLEPVRLGDADDEADSDTETISVTGSEYIPTDLEGSIKDDSEGNLGGVWRYRQIADEISLGDNDDDEQTDYTDDSALSTPLPDADMSFFDPLHPAPDGDTIPGVQDNSWLLSAMSACAKLETEEEGSGVANVEAPPASQDEAGQSGANPDQLDTLLQSAQEVDSSDRVDGLHGELGVQSVPQHSSFTNKRDSLTSTDVSMGATGLVPSPSRSRTTSGSHSDAGSHLTDEFDPLKSRSGSKVEVGKGDLNFSLMSMGSEMHTPLSGEGTPTHAAPSHTPLSNQSESTPSPGSPPGSQKGSPARSNKPQFTMMDLRDKGQYIVQAANQISLAQQCEANGSFDMAFNYYKSGVAILLTGVQVDDNKARRDVVRRKTARYLMKAEEIYKAHMARKGPDDNRWDPGQVSPATELDPTVVLLSRPASELRNLRVLGIIDKVLLVLDKTTETMETTYVVKVLHKSSNPSLISANIVPTRCPYMVQLNKFYETESAVYLLLQHASGGKLWTYISAYLQTHQENFVEDVFDDAHERKLRTQTLVPSIDSDSSVNVYSGQQMHITQSSGSSTQTDSLQCQLPDTTSASPMSHDSDLQALPESATGYSQLFTSNEHNQSLSQQPPQNQSEVSDITETSAKESVVTSQPSGVRRDSDFLSLDGSHDASHLHAYFSHVSAVHSDSVLQEDSTDEQDRAGSRPADRSDGEHFQALLKETKPSLELFSIGSFESDSKPGGQGSASDYFESIPEEGSLSPVHRGSKPSFGEPESPSEDSVFPSPLHSNHGNVVNIQSIGAVPNLVTNSLVSDQTAQGVKESDVNGVVTNGPQMNSDASELNNHWVPEKAQNCDVSPSESIDEPSIYDTHRATDTEDSNDTSPCNTYTSTPLAEKKSLKLPKDPVEVPKSLPLDTQLSSNHKNARLHKQSSNQSGAKSQNNQSGDKQASSSRTRTPSGRSPLDSSRAPMYRMPSQERSMEAELKPRKRNLSSVFSELDLAEEGLKTSIHLPEGCIKQWAAEIVVAICVLHRHGIVCRDLHPANILLGERGHVLLTYFSRWASVDRVLAAPAVEQLYVAPEVFGVGTITSACDWWSLGVLLFELLTGKTLCSCYPAGVTSHTCIQVPEHVSQEGEALLQELLRYNPKERLGWGAAGSEDIRHHPFFSGIDWKSLQG